MLVCTYPICVVKIQYPASVLINVLVARFRAAHDERGVHVDVMAGKVERDQALEDDGPARERGGQEDKQARGRAAVSDHVENGPEACALLVVAGGVAVEGVEQARDAVEERARARVQRHVVKGENGEHYSNITWTARFLLAGSAFRLSSCGGELEKRYSPMRFGANRKMFSCGSEDTVVSVWMTCASPFPFERTFCSVKGSGVVDFSGVASAEAAKAACRRVLAPAMVMQRLASLCGLFDHRLSPDSSSRQSRSRAPALSVSFRCSLVVFSSGQTNTEDTRDLGVRVCGVTLLMLARDSSSFGFGFGGK